jgi:hypothetical protein
MREKVFVAIVFLTFWMSFFANAWRIVSPEWFRTQNRGAESLVVARLIVSRQYAVFYKGGLTGDIDGDWDDDHPELVEDTYTKYLENAQATVFRPYLSQPGGQAVFLATLDRSLPFAPLLKLRFYYALVSLLSAIAITMIVAWIYRVAGVWAGAAAFIGTLFSSWLIVFGKNLWWFLPAFYVPFLVLAYMLGKKHDGARDLILATCIAVLVKYAANGYEYVTTVWLMMLVPVVYYGIADSWNQSRALRILSAVVAGTTLATVVSVAVHSLQIRIATGSFQNAADHFVYALAKRTYGDPSQFSPMIAQSLRTPIFTVLKMYLGGYYFWHVKYWHLFSVFILAILAQATNPRNRQDRAFLISVCFSVLAPLSWFVIFKGHSGAHTNQNFIVWQMPFTLLGFGLMGRAAATVIDSRRAFAPYRTKHISSPSSPLPET